MSANSSPSESKNYLLPYSWLFMCASLFFIVYGSLIPFDFKSIEIQYALEQFLEILQQSKLVSRSDFATNILITIPLSFSLSAVLSRYYYKHNIIIFLGAFLFSLTTSVFVEFMQIYTTNRVPSRSDIAAQFVGVIIGYILWQIKGQQVSKWLSSWADNKEVWHFYEKLLWLYVVFLCIYNILPLELITTPVEIIHKWETGKIQLLPFQMYSQDRLFLVYQFTTDVLIWLPITLLWILSRKKSSIDAFFWTIRLAVIIETIQLFIFPRVTDIGDIITAIIGAALAIMLSNYFIAKKNIKKDNLSQSILSVSNLYLFLFLWSCLLIIIFWYPFTFNFDKKFFIVRMEFIYEIPLLSYFYTPAFVAITTFFQKILLLSPVGILLKIIQHQKTLLSSMTVKTIAILWTLSLVFIIEMGQVFIPEHNPDTSDIVIGLISVYFAFLCTQYYYQHTGKAMESEKKIIKSNNNLIIVFSTRKKVLITFLIVAFQIASFVLLVEIVGHIEKIPYNIRELFSEGNLFQHIIFICAVLVCFLTPLFLLRQIRQNINFIFKLYPFILLSSVFVFFLLWLSVPDESIYDIIGGPQLHWSWSWNAIVRFGESIGRFAILYGSIFWCLAGAYLLNVRKQRNFLQSFYLWIMLSIMIFPLSHYIIIIEAGTDNVTELMRNNGSWYSSSLVFIGLFIMFYVTNLIGSIISGDREIQIKHSIILIASFPLSYYLVVSASEPFLFKYDKVFSALQFLLSPDRDHYLPQDKIFFYYMAAYFLLILSIVWFQLVFWISRRFTRS